MTFSQYQQNKSNSWFARVNKNKSKAVKSDVPVAINIGMLAWNDKAGSIKPLRGKRITLRVSSGANYEVIRANAVKRFADFYKNIVSEELSYSLTFESGEEALCIPGTCEEFTIKRYKEEIGKEYKNITLYLLSDNDKMVWKNIESSPLNEELPLDDYFHNLFDDEHFFDPTTVLEKEDFSSPCKKRKAELADETFARNLQNAINNEAELLQPEKHVFSTLPELLVHLKKNIIEDKQLFIVVRRGASLDRHLTLWKRETRKQNPQSKLTVHFSGESGIDVGAMHKEFLTDIIADLRNYMFKNGVPRDSMSDVQNSNYFSSGQIAAASLVHGGPPPCFFHPNMFHLMLQPDIDLKKLELDTHFVPADLDIFEKIREDPVQVADVIIENGYTGVINKENVNTILGTVMIGITSRRLSYLKEFLRGLELFGVKDFLQTHKQLLTKVFVQDNSGLVDANYVFSLLKPLFSSESSSKRITEELIMDHFQDFLMMLEDENVCGSSEALAYHCDETNPEECEKEAIAQLTPAGVMKWLTGQSHKPLCQDDIEIMVSFNHDCMDDNPKHTICFPVVHACSKEIVLPCIHMKSFEDFKHCFMLAFCKGQAFGIQ